MDMTAYVENIEYAAMRLLDANWAERSKLDGSTRRLRSLEAETAAGYRRAHLIGLDAEDPDDVALAMMLTRFRGHPE